MSHEHLRFTRDRAQDAFGSLKSQVFARIRERGESTSAGPTLWAKGTVLLALAVGVYLWLLTASPGGAYSVILSLIGGVAILMFALNVSHDAAHGAFARNSRINTFLLYAAFVPLGVDPVMWRARHLNSHHRFPNVDECDADIDENPFIRLSPHQRWRVWHRAQHLYAWALYAVVALHAAWIQDLIYMRKTRLANMNDWPERRPSWTKFAGTKFLHFVLVYALPLWKYPAPAGRILAGILVIQAVVSLLFILPLIGTHFSSTVQFPEAANGAFAHGYVTHQIVTSVDWRPRSRLAGALVGGLNAHAAHHLFPRVSHAHYPWISGEIERFCGEVGLEHKEVGLFSAIRNHYRFLRSLAIDT